MKLNELLMVKGKIELNIQFGQKRSISIKFNERLAIMKEEYLKNINDLYKKICDIASLDKKPCDVSNLVIHILEQILKLKQIDNILPYLRNYDDLNRTLGKQVVWVDIAYREMIKKNAAKVRQQEYYSELNKALDQIRIDLIGLLER